MNISQNPEIRSINATGRRFLQLIMIAKEQESRRIELQRRAEKIPIIGTGKALTVAYESIRQAAEYTEDHLLLQRAICRYYRRLFLVRDPELLKTNGDELLIELTLAGYIPNESISGEMLDKITQLGRTYFDLYIQLGAHRSSSETRSLDILAVRVENLINDHSTSDAFGQFCYEYFLGTFREDPHFVAPEYFELGLFVAVFRSLLRADDVSIRSALMARFAISSENLKYYEEFHDMLDKVFASKNTDMLVRKVSRHGAPLRILRSMVEKNETDIATVLSNRHHFLNAYEQSLQREYLNVSEKIRRGIIKSVIFLIITKTVIGVAIEVPYDMWIHSEIIWVPLIINLLFPPLYMILLSRTLTLPGDVSTRAMVNKVDTIFYGEKSGRVLGRRTRATTFGVGYTIMYAIFFVMIFGSAGFYLWTLGFEALHLLIFFIFLSTASFLGFRLSRLVRDIEMVDGSQSGVSLVRDFLYMPFVAVGQWISDKYSKINIVSNLLDMLIELPLKTILRMLRQWARFISAKKDEL